MRRAVVLVALFAPFVLPQASRAQTASLSGTFIDYVAIGAFGSMLASTPTGESCAGSFSCIGGGFCDFDTFECRENRSMRFHDTVGGTASCDAFSPGSPVETFTVEYSAGGSTGNIVTNGSGFGQFTPVSGPVAVGREILWSGAFEDGAGVGLTIDQIHTYEPDDAFVRLTVTLTNSGTVPLSDIYYLRNADPDFGSCGIGSSTATDNDVRRQPPMDESALVTSGGGDMASADRYVVLGIGSHDDRARGHAGGFENTDASGEWAMPQDPEGSSGDIGQDLVFFEPGAFPPGATLTFEILYVWGSSAEDVEARFDTVGAPTSPCGALAEGAMCDVRGRPGTCRASRCCTGCWNGTRCVSGSASACGLGGGACVSCADGDLCTSDVCAAGVCTNPDAPRGTSCDDGLFCTRTDTCDGSGACGGAGDACDDARSCTIDTCNETANACSNVMGRGCIVGGECVGEGSEHPTYPCLYCDPDRDAADWSSRAAGTSCRGARCLGGFLYEAGVCSADGFCDAPRGARCPTGSCADETACEVPCTASSCAAGEYCDASRRCRRLGMPGDGCSEAAACGSGFCVDGVCCSSACEGTCETCSLEGQAGTCAPVANGTDLIGECGPDRACDGMRGCRANRSDAGTRDAGTRDGGADASTGDAGLDGGDGGPEGMDAGLDGGVGPDAGTPPARSDCACRAGRAGTPPALGLGLALLGFVGARWARRRRSLSGKRPSEARLETTGAPR